MENNKFFVRYANNLVTKGNEGESTFDFKTAS